MKRRLWRSIALPALALGALALHDAAADDQRVLHEFIEHFSGQQQTAPGRSAPPAPAPASATAPRPGSGASDEPAAGAESGEGAELGGDTFRIDSDTSRPDNVRYTDPFTPEVAPFKRSVAYDAVDADFELYVADRTLVPVARGELLGPTTEHFHAELELVLLPGQAQRIPSVGPGARVRVAHTEPTTPFQIVKDSAENWFIRSPVTRDVRLVLQLAVDRRSFGSPLPDPSYAALAGELPSVPEIVKDNAREVAELLGVPRSARPREVISLLVDHFRRFRPSDRRFTGHGASLYRQLAVSRRGVCRHRAYAFVVTALGLGVPARMVLNEAHAWVEVYDGALWQRIDLGGAAENLELDASDRPRHVQPRDPFTWPEGSDPASEMVDRGEQDRAEPPVGDVPASAPVEPEGEVDPMDPGTAPGVTPEPAPAPSAPEPPPPSPTLRLTIDAAQGRALRGEGFEVSGSVAVLDRACPQVQVEVALVQRSGGSVALGTLLTDDRGQFSGRLAIPWSLPLGDYTLSAASPQASEACGR